MEGVFQENFNEKKVYMDILPEMLQNVKDLPIKHYCGSYAWFNKETGEPGVFFCGCASCGRAYCQKLYYIKRVRLQSDLIIEYDLKRFFTLTMKRNMSAREAWVQIPLVWGKARRILVRENPDLLFSANIEAHKDGYPHIHGFTNIWLHTSVWSKIFEKCGGGKIAWLEKVDMKDGAIPEYVCKQLGIARYIGKEQVITARQMLKPRARSFWRSRDMKTKYEKREKKSGIIMVSERLYKETEKGFDKLFDISYNEDIGHYVMCRKIVEPVQTEAYQKENERWQNERTRTAL
jgi:hypothetical protein